MHAQVAISNGDQEARLLQSLALAIGGAEDLDQALTLALREIGQTAGWVTGEAWLPDAGQAVLRRGPVWSEPSQTLQAFHEVSDAFTFARGEGLVGRVWRSGTAAWRSEIGRDPEFQRARQARVAALRTAAAIPVLAGREVVAVLVFYHFEARARDAALIGLISAVAAQLGMLVRRKRAEDELARQALELAQANAELQRFIWLASHDFNEPLRMVTLYTQWLAERCADRLDREEQEAIGFAVEGAKHMHALLDDFRIYAEVGGPAEPAGPGETGEGLDAVLDRALEGLAPRIRETGARIEREPLPMHLAGAAELGLVLEHLIANALTFQRPGEVPRVRVSAEPKDGQWVIAVADNGIGIEPGERDRIFEPFQRLHPRSSYPGTGIGLAICRRVVQRHGGRIWFQSEPGRGTTFCFSLPAGPRPCSVA